MGSVQSNISPANGLEKCLLTKQEFVHLRCGDKIDHRDGFGMFAKAIILQKSGNKVYIQYEGYSEKWNTTDNYSKNPYSFAKCGSVSRGAATSALQGRKTGDYIAFRPNLSDNNCGWRKGKIIQMDQHSGQVLIKYKNTRGQLKERWTHLDNEYEITQLQKNVKHTTQQRSHNSYVSNHSQQHRSTNSNNYGYENRQYQMQRQKQIQRQDQMTVRTQLLLDDTNKQLKLTKNYLDAVNKNNCSKEELSIFNQKVVCGLTCFKMKVNGMRKNAEKEGLDFDDAFKSSGMIIKKFERNYKKQFGQNKFLMNRLEPCLNYMRAVLKGCKDIPSLPYVDDYEFNQNTASNVISSVAYSMNHIIPDRMDEISKNNKQYKSNQSQLKKQYENDQNNKNNETVSPINYNNLIQDFKGDIAFAKSKKQQNEIIENQQNEYRFQAPDLQNMDCDQDHYWI